MNEILSKDEVELLLSALEGGEVDTHVPDRFEGRTVEPYDLVGENRIERSKMPGLELVNKRFVKLVRDSASGLLSVPCVAAARRAGVVEFARFRERIAPSSAVVVFRAGGDAAGRGLAVFPAPLVLKVVELFFGGAEDGGPPVEREQGFTEIELHVLGRFARLVLADLSRAWEGLGRIEFSLERIEASSELTGVVSSAEEVIEAAFSIKLASLEEEFFVCIPLAAVESLREKLYAEEAEPAAGGPEEDVMEERMAEVLLETPLLVRVEIGGVELKLEELIGLEVGNTINLYVPLDEEVEVCVEGVPAFKGTTGISRGSHAVRVTSIL